MDPEHEMIPVLCASSVYTTCLSSVKKDAIFGECLYLIKAKISKKDINYVIQIYRGSTINTVHEAPMLSDYKPNF